MSHPIHCDVCGEVIVGTVFNVGDSMEVLLVGACCNPESDD